MRAFLLLASVGLLILPGWGCGKGEYDRRLEAAISGIGANSENDDDTPSTPDEAFARLLEKNCMFFDSSTGVSNMTLAEAKSASKLTEYDENVSYDVVLDGSSMSDADTALLVSLGSRVNGITLAGGFGDSAMKNALRLRGLTWINLLGTNITDSGLNTLGDAASVQSFRLIDNNNVTDAAIVAILAMENLRRVYLAGPFSDTGIEELGYNPNIQVIEVKLGGDVTQAGIDFLKQELPDSTITAK